MCAVSGAEGERRQVRVSPGQLSFDYRPPDNPVAHGPERRRHQSPNRKQLKCRPMKKHRARVSELFPVRLNTNGHQHGTVGSMKRSARRADRSPRRALQLDQRGHVIGSIPVIGVEKSHCLETLGDRRQSSHAPREVPVVGVWPREDEVLRDPRPNHFVRMSVGNQDMGARIRLSRDGLKTLPQEFIAFTKIGSDDGYPHRALPLGIRLWHVRDSGQLPHKPAA